MDTEDGRQRIAGEGVGSKASVPDQPTGTIRAHVRPVTSRTWKTIVESEREVNGSVNLYRNELYASDEGRGPGAAPAMPARPGTTPRPTTAARARPAAGGSGAAAARAPHGPAAPTGPAEAGPARAADPAAAGGVGTRPPLPAAARAVAPSGARPSAFPAAARPATAAPGLTARPPVSAAGTASRPPSSLDSGGPRRSTFESGSRATTASSLEGQAGSGGRRPEPTRLSDMVSARPGAGLGGVEGWPRDDGGRGGWELSGPGVPGWRGGGGPRGGEGGGEEPGSPAKVLAPPSRGIVSVSARPGSAPAARAREARSSAEDGWLEEALRAAVAGRRPAELRALLDLPAGDADVVRCHVQRRRLGLLRRRAEYSLYLERGGGPVATTCVERAGPGAPPRHLIAIGDSAAAAAAAAGAGGAAVGRVERAGGAAVAHGQGPGAGAAEFEAWWDLPGSSVDPDEPPVAVRFSRSAAEASGPRQLEVALAARRLPRGGVRPATRLSSIRPRWNESLGAYCLNFQGRVTRASVKNFQLGAGGGEDRVVLQFGRVSRDGFTMDYASPLSMFQAFAICLACFDARPLAE